MGRQNLSKLVVSGDWIDSIPKSQQCLTVARRRSPKFSIRGNAGTGRSGDVTFVDLVYASVAV